MTTTPLRKVKEDLLFRESQSGIVLNVIENASVLKRKPYPDVFTELVHS